MTAISSLNEILRGLRGLMPKSPRAGQETGFKINIEVSTICKNVPINKSFFYLIVCCQDTQIKTVSLTLSLSLQDFFFFICKNQKTKLECHYLKA